MGGVILHGGFHRAPGQRQAIEKQVEATRADIRLRKWSYTTERSYCAWVRRYGIWLAMAPEARSAVDSTARVTGYLTQLVSGPSPRSGTTLKQALNALVYYYREVRREPLGRLADLPKPKQSVRLPHVLTREQVRALIGAVVDSSDYPFRLICRVLYHTGMRISDVLDLRIQDIDVAHSEIILRAGKGDKDRIVPLPCCLIGPLRKQIERARSSWQWDRANRPNVGVTLPGQLAKKYPSAPYAWQWFWLFPAPGHCTHPRTGEIVHWRLHEASLQRAKLDTVVTPHNIRHAYATHSREDVQVIQRILGHANIETTMGYRHREITGASSPLDEIMT